MSRNLLRFLNVSAAALLVAAPAMAQFGGIAQPPSGDNQSTSITQGIGPVRVSVEYNSPNVHGPAGEDRRGKIWGDLVPYGMTNLGFGSCGDQCPWRGGSNENTVFTVSHDVKIQGQPLPAGTYGLHFLPGQDEWTVIFSKNHTAWGSYFYDAKEDALRVKTKPEKGAYHEWLDYEFTDRQPDKATLALQWEDLQVPFTITVDDVAGLYMAEIRRELQSSPGFNWQNWVTAARYSLNNKRNLDEGLRWAEEGVSQSVGQENFTSLVTLADLQAANGKTEDAKKTMDRALNHRTASPVDIHQYGRQLQAQQKNEEAMKIFELNAKRFPNTWPVHVGLARGNAALGRKKEALAQARLGLQYAPDEASRRNLEALIKQIESAP